MKNVTPSDVTRAPSGVTAQPSRGITPRPRRTSPRRLQRYIAFAWRMQLQIGIEMGVLATTRHLCTLSNVAPSAMTRATSDASAQHYIGMSPMPRHTSSREQQRYVDCTWRLQHQIGLNRDWGPRGDTSSPPNVEHCVHRCGPNSK